MSHDYHPSQDYRIVRLRDCQISRQQHRTVLQVIRQVNNSLVELMKFDRPPEFYFLNDGDVLGKYISGTSTRPVILIDPSAVARAVDQKRFDTQLYLTFAHELAHAYQDSLGLLDETEHTEANAELFAQCWVCDGIYCPEVLQY